MGTHPIFESDFDCLTDKSNMGAYKYMNEIWRKKQSETMRYLQRIRVWQYRNLNVIHRASKPRRPDVLATRPNRDTLFIESESDVVDVRSPCPMERPWENQYTWVCSLNLLVEPKALQRSVLVDTVAVSESSTPIGSAKTQPTSITR